MPRIFLLSLFFLFSLFLPLLQGTPIEIFAQDGMDNDRFGSSIAVDGHLVVVGAPGQTLDEKVSQGSAYVFYCPPYSLPSSPSSLSPNCTQISHLTANNGDVDDAFGYSVGISGSLVAVGDPFADAQMGAVYIFDCTSSACIQQGIISPGVFGNFGHRVALDGGLLAVSAIALNNYQGSVFVYDCSNPASCSFITNFTASDVANYNRFGQKMALSGSTVVVGLSGKNSNAGAAYIFSCSPTSCPQVARLTAPGLLLFGDFVAISGTRMAIRAVEAGTSQAIVSIYDCPTPTSCSLTTKQAVSGGTNSIAISGSLIVVGDPNQGWYQGSATIFTCPPSSNCTQVTKLTRPIPLSQVGSFVALDGMMVVAGAKRADVPGNTSQGSAIVHYVSTCPPDTYGNTQWPSVIENVAAIGTCIPGYSGKPSRTCKSDGTWQDLIRNHCTQNQCAPKTEFDAEWPLTTQGKNSTGVCLPGFVGSPIRACLINGTFAGTLLSGFCISSSSGSCPSELFGNANWPNGTLLGSDAIGVCVNGWTGSPIRKCKIDGTWEPLIRNSCAKIPCPAETVDNTEWPQTNQGYRAYGTCINGFIGSPSRFCNSMGQWQPIQDPCMPAGTCPAERYNRADWEETQPGETATGTCIPGWTGTPTRICKSNGTWQDLVRNLCVRI